MTTIPSDDKLLGHYLNDHLAGATAGTELIKRLAGENRDQIGGQVLTRLVDEINADRDALQDVMVTLGVPIRRYKTWLGWAGEKVGRLKPNGQLLTHSPLSRVLGLEAMVLGIEGKAALWRTLRARAENDSRLDTARFDRLIDRARDQATRVERLRAWAAAEAFGGETDALTAIDQEA